MAEEYHANYGIFRLGNEVVTTTRLKASAIAFREKNLQYVDIPKGTVVKVLGVSSTNLTQPIPTPLAATNFGNVYIPEYFLDFA